MKEWTISALFREVSLHKGSTVMIFIGLCSVLFPYRVVVDP